MSDKSKKKQLAEELAAAISPCCICGKDIDADDLVRKHKGAYCHEACHKNFLQQARDEMEKEVSIMRRYISTGKYPDLES